MCPYCEMYTNVISQKQKLSKGNKDHAHIINHASDISKNETDQQDIKF